MPVAMAWDALTVLALVSLLMLALILIPLVLLLILFGGQIYNAASNAWNNVMNSSL